MLKLRINPIVAKDLKNIRDYIAEDNEEYAAKTIKEIFYYKKTPPQKEVFFSSEISSAVFCFFFLCFTHSVRRYSICPFSDLKSSFAHADSSA